MSDFNQWLALISKFPWAIVIIILIIAITSLKVLYDFKKNKSISSAECGNYLFKLKLRRGEDQKDKNDD